MKETVNVNIGSQSFTIDRDAFRMLDGYLDDIRSRLPEEDAETMDDIEIRLAEIFREKVPSPMMVITIAAVREAMSQMGAPSDFGEKRGTAAEEAAAPRRLFRSRSNRSIAGICSGIAEFFDCDTTLVRIVTLLLIFCGGLSIWIYVILWIIIPEEPLRPFRPNNSKNIR